MTLVTVTPVLNSVIHSSNSTSSVNTTEQQSASSINVANGTSVPLLKYTYSPSYLSHNSNIHTSSNGTSNDTNITLNEQLFQEEDLMSNVMSSDPIFIPTSTSTTSDSCDWSGSGIDPVQSSSRAIVPIHLRCNSGTIRWKYPRNGLRIVLNSDGPFKGCIKVSSLLTESFVTSTLLHHRSYRQRRQPNPQTHSLYPVRISLEGKNVTNGNNYLSVLYDPFDGKSIDLLRCFTVEQGKTAALFVEALTPLNVDVPSTDTSSSYEQQEQMKHHNHQQHQQESLSAPAGATMQQDKSTATTTITSVNNVHVRRKQLHATVTDDASSSITQQLNQQVTKVHPSSIILPSVRENFRFDYHLIPLTGQVLNEESTNINTPSRGSPVASNNFNYHRVEGGNDECRPCTDDEVIESFCTADFVMKGSISDISTVKSLDRTELTVIIDRLIRDVTSDPSQIMDTSSLLSAPLNPLTMANLLDDELNDHGSSEAFANSPITTWSIDGRRMAPTLLSTSDFSNSNLNSKPDLKLPASSTASVRNNLVKSSQATGSGLSWFLNLVPLPSMALDALAKQVPRSSNERYLSSVSGRGLKGTSSNDDQVSTLPSARARTGFNLLDGQYSQQLSTDGKMNNEQGAIGQAFEKRSTSNGEMEHFNNPRHKNGGEMVQLKVISPVAASGQITLASTAIPATSTLAAAANGASRQGNSIVNGNNVIKQQSHKFIRAQGSASPEKLVTVLHRPAKCHSKKATFDHLQFLFTGHWILGNPIVKCAPTYQQFELIRAKALKSGSNLCNLNV